MVVAVVALLLAGAGLNVTLFLTMRAQVVSQAGSIQDLKAQISALKIRDQPQLDWSAIATLVRPSVVTISTDKGLGSGWVVFSDDSGSDLVTNLHVVAAALESGNSTVDVAISAGQSISDLLNEMKTKALSAADGSLDTASRNALNADFVGLRDQITTIVQNASFNGTNLVDGSVTNIQALASTDGSKKITVTGQALKLSGVIVTVKATSTISTSGKASTMVAAIDSSIQNVNSALAKLASGEKKFSIQNDFVSKLMDTLNTGIGNLVDADMAQESAKFQSLQVKQQLGVQALAIANSAPSIALSLFR